MARYTCVMQLTGTTDTIRPTVKQLLEADTAKFQLIYDSRDYWVAREVPGDMPFSRLVTIEMLLDSVRPDCTQVTCIAKNEELPLQIGNHCEQVFSHLEGALQQIQQTVATGYSY